MKKRIMNLKNRKLILSLFCVMVISILCGFILSSYSAQELIPSVEVETKTLNYKDKMPGSFRVTKSARWISRDQVRVRLDLESISSETEKGKDIIFLIDTSDAMKNEKLLEIKKGLTNIINSVLMDSNNRIVLITYSSDSKVISSLTNNKNDLLEKLEGIEIETGERNYYQALRSVERTLKKLKPTNERDTRVVLITGGYPNKETPGEVGEYNYLKEEYPSIPMNAIEYEVEGISSLDEISDEVYTSTSETIQSDLYASLGITNIYETFEVKDTIREENFQISSIKNTKNTYGSVETSNNQVIWNLDGFPSGRKSRVEYILTVKEDSDTSIYPTNRKSEIRYSINNVEEEITSRETPIVKREFEVVYDMNPPRGCTIEKEQETETHRVYDQVEMKDITPVCEGYTAKRN